MNDATTLTERGTPGSAMQRSSRAGAEAARAGTSIARMAHGTAISSQRCDKYRLIHDDMSDVRPSDLFRELRTRLLLQSGLDNPVILVSGVRERCGASFIARNLAAAIALDEDRTALLVDCNLRRPSMHEVFEAEHQPGLGDYLSSRDLSLDRIIHPTGIERLRMIPAGSGGRHGGERLASLRMRALVDELRGRYPDRCVVLDAPPSRGSPEARMLGQRADIVLLVAGEGMHVPADVVAAAEVFDPARFAGVVFNALP